MIIKAGLIYAKSLALN
jgi:hypothetical protein